MEDISIEIENGIAELLELFNDVEDEVGDNPTDDNIRGSIGNFVEIYKNYKSALYDCNTEQIAEIAGEVCINANKLGLNAIKSNSNPKIREYGNKLSKAAIELQEKIERFPLLTPYLTDTNRLNVSDEMREDRVATMQLKEIAERHKLYDERIKKLLAESEQKAVVLGEKIKVLEGEYSEKLKVVTELYESELVNIEDKNTQINKLLGDAAGRVIVSDYAVSAEQEKTAANWLRMGSLLCMGLIVIIAGYSFWESIGQSFDLSNSLLRLALVFLLSVSAAYLARESTKHRQQQYTHPQTSLDLKAINPYIASLPEEEQHKIKSEIAQRIFAPKDFQSLTNESYPINSQEVIMALISKFDNKDK